MGKNKNKRLISKMKLLEGKTAIVTGGSRGIGKAVAEMFAREGANVIITRVKESNDTEQLLENLRSYGVQAEAFVFDVADFTRAHEVVKEVQQKFGRIDILVNNAGITRDTLLMRMTEAQWDEVLAVNLKSAFNLSHAVATVMMKQRSGSIINMSSVVGITGNAGQTNYAAAKAGIIGFTKSLAKELGSRGIRANAIAPGFVETDMTEVIPQEAREAWVKNIPLQRGGKPEDIANATLFLASDMASYITGQVISVCGGMNI